MPLLWNWVMSTWTTQHQQKKNRTNQIDIYSIFIPKKKSTLAIELKRMRTACDFSISFLFLLCFVINCMLFWLVCTCIFSVFDYSFLCIFLPSLGHSHISNLLQKHFTKIVRPFECHGSIFSILHQIRMQSTFIVSGGCVCVRICVRDGKSACCFLPLGWN